MRSIGICEPVPAPLAGRLRHAVLEFRNAERRKLFDPVLHVGVPGGVDRVFGVHAADEPIGHALRADVVASLLAGAGASAGDRTPLVWLTRPGDLALHDVDAAWLSAAWTAYAEAGRPLTMVVVTRQGWWDPRSGAHREWRRLRGR